MIEAQYKYAGDGDIEIWTIVHIYPGPGASFSRTKHFFIVKHVRAGDQMIQTPQSFAFQSWECLCIAMF
jgi:hypothetical protein